MTAKKYRSAMGKTIDIGALMLQNENVRAVGNMSVNARGDTLDSNNQVIDSKAQQIQRQQRKTNVIGEPRAKNQQVEPRVDMKVDPTDTFSDLPEDEVLESAPVVDTGVPQGGLAAAIAKAKTVKQEKIVPTKLQQKMQPGVRKIGRAHV